MVSLPAHTLSYLSLREQPYINIELTDAILVNRVLLSPS